jgi:hypothetical protein
LHQHPIKLRRHTAFKTMRGNALHIFKVPAHLMPIFKAVAKPAPNSRPSAEGGANAPLVSDDPLSRR